MAEKMTPGSRIIILGCPGSGKSTLARRLRDRTMLPLFHLDNIWWKADHTHVTREEFDKKLEKLLQREKWIIDGDYSRTYEPRFRCCDTVVFLDYGEEICMDGIRRRIGEKRPDIPWTENRLDPELVELVHCYQSKNRPEILELIKQNAEKQILVFKSRAQAAAWIDSMPAREENTLIRKASGEEMLKLWGYSDERTASPTARFFYRNISRGNAVFWTLDSGGDLIGELYAFLDLEDKDFADGINTAYLCAFRVKKEYRGQGLGSRLMEAALAGLRELGFHGATIGVADDEPLNIELYRRFGFTVKIKDCHYDPCGMDENMRPAYDEAGWWLLKKEL